MTAGDEDRDRSTDGTTRQDDGSALDRPKLGLALGVGSVVIVLLVLGSLLAQVLGPAVGMERGAVWAILLMILVTFLTLGGIGYGLYRTIRPTEEEGPEKGEAPTASRPPEEG